MKLFRIVPIILIISIFSSCSMVKNLHSSNFHRVKYNAHLKVDKKSETERVEAIEPMRLQEADLLSTTNSIPPKPKLDKKRSQPEFAFSNEFREEPSSQSIETEQMVVSTKNDLIEPKTYNFWTPVEGFRERSEVNLNAPVNINSEEGLGNLLYWLLVIILVLIVISLIADLAGGLIGALIAVLLILLILRILGYV